MRTRILALATSALLAACNSSSDSDSPTGPSTSNRPPAIGALTVSPQGTGIESATVFTFVGQNVSDPDGDALTYVWQSSDGRQVAANGQTATHAYANSGVFQMSLTATDTAGLSASATAAIDVGSVSGTWDLTCARTTYAIESCVGFPSRFVATLTQVGNSLLGSMSGGGRTRGFTSPGSVRDPRAVTFGFESRDNVFCGPNFDNDIYFRLAANATLTSMSSTSSNQYCESVVATKR